MKSFVFIKYIRLGNNKEIIFNNALGKWISVEVRTWLHAYPFKMFSCLISLALFSVCKY